MTKFDHRLKRLEKKTEESRHPFKIWPLSMSDMKKFAAGKLSSTDNRSLLSIDMLKKSLKDYNEEDKNIFVFSAIPRSKKVAGGDFVRIPEKTKDLKNLTDEELDAEIASVQKELEK